MIRTVNPRSTIGTASSTYISSATLSPPPHDDQGGRGPVVPRGRFAQVARHGEVLLVGALDRGGRQSRGRAEVFPAGGGRVLAEFVGDEVVHLDDAQVDAGP
jgi:hypothetical protein